MTPAERERRARVHLIMAYLDEAEGEIEEFRRLAATRLGALMERHPEDYATAEALREELLMQPTPPVKPAKRGAERGAGRRR